MTVRVRFAPSPTGYLHVGGLRTALYNWLFARKHGGKFVLRIEDTDQSRKVEGAVDSLIDMLSWAGLDMDEGPHIGGPLGPYTQSERLETYRNHADKLIENGTAYYCFCTAERLTQVRERQQKMGLAVRYDRHCRNLTTGDVRERAKSEPHVVRLAIPESGRVTFKDIIRKKVAFDWQQLDDQVLIKTDGFPTYHLANVVDDHLMEISHVIRGEEWLPSMPKHLFLYESFGWEPPTFAHLPLLLNPDRSKLSKRQGDVAVESYRDRGYLPAAMLNFVALLGWHEQGNRDIFTLTELIDAFEIGRVQKGGAIFDATKLNWINGQHIRQLPPDEFAAAIRPHLAPEWDVTKAMVAAIQTKVNLLSDAHDQLAFFFEDPVVYDEDSRQALSSAQAKGVLSTLLAGFDAVSDFSGDWFLGIVKQIGEDFSLKGRDLWHPIRAAVAGRVTGPDIVTIVETFGLEKVRDRIQAALNFE
ncbi:MAG: glutamate--tRNA ligase [Candidatus Marinimicrobia bacterium]|nr:glutamate--tRNA ligase [Candidatus Neomarinimicrobiota bacterium]